MTFPPDSLLAKTNKWLICLYVLSCGLGLTSCIFFALVWSHWHSTLNSCYASDCGCVLYVMTTLNVIAGKRFANTSGQCPLLTLRRSDRPRSQDFFATHTQIV
jgi:hypothetical protein